MNQPAQMSDRPPQTNLAWTVTIALLATVAMWLVHLVALAAWIAFMVKVVPFYKQYYEANNVELPGATIATLDWSTATLRYWYLFVLALIVFDGGLLLGLQFLPKRWSWVRSVRQPLDSRLHRSARSLEDFVFDYWCGRAPDLPYLPDINTRQ
jgi:hypothetical protein